MLNLRNAPERDYMASAFYWDFIVGTYLHISMKHRMLDIFIKRHGKCYHHFLLSWILKNNHLDNICFAVHTVAMGIAKNFASSHFTVVLSCLNPYVMKKILPMFYCSTCFIIINPKHYLESHNSWPKQV